VQLPQWIREDLPLLKLRRVQLEEIKNSFLEGNKEYLVTS
jgi:hypothetical protein